MRRSSAVLAVLAVAACLVEREAPPGPQREAAPRTDDAAPAAPGDGAAPRPDAVPSPGPRAAPGPAGPEALEQIVRPEARAADAPPLPEPPPPQARRAAGVVLLEAGAEPRAPIRLSPVVGKTEALRLQLAMTVAMQLGRQAVPAQAVPGLTVDLDLNVAARDPDGTTRYATKVVDTRVATGTEASARVSEALQSAATKLAGARGEATVGPRGITEGFGLDLDLSDEQGLAPTFEGFREAYAHLFVALPTEAVGAGARWEVVSHGELSGLPVQRVATYTLRARDADHLVLDVKLGEHATTPAAPAAESARGEKPAADAGGSPGPVRAQSYVAEGSGHVEIDLGRVAPRSGELRTSSTTQVQASFGGEPQAVGMELQVTAKLGARHD